MGEELAGAADEPVGPGAAGTVDVYLHCKTGVRSARAQELLEGVLGADSTLRLIDLAGGYEAWVRDTGGDA